MAALLAAALSTHAAMAAAAAPVPAPASGLRLGSLINSFVVVTVLALALAGFLSRKGTLTAQPRFSGYRLRFALGAPLVFLALTLLDAITGFPGSGWVAFPLWAVLTALFVALGGRLAPEPLRRLWAALVAPRALETHGSAQFGTAALGARHLVPQAPADAFVLGTLRECSRRGDARFRQDGHILTCAPTGAGKGLGGVIPNLLAYPGSALVLDFKGENHAVTARARRALGQRVILVDPFGITGAPAQALNWLDTLDPDDPDVVSRAASLADMLVASEGADSDSHWNDTARELLRGLLVYVAGLPEERRSMAELRRLVTAARDDLADTLAAMIADPQRQRIGLPARAATAHLNRPEKERGSVLSTVVRHTAWLDDPRLCAALARSDFHLSDLKRTPMTVYLALPPDRLRACLGFVRGFIGLALDAITAVPGPAGPPRRLLPRRVRPARAHGPAGRHHHPAARLRRSALGVRPGPVPAQGRLPALAELPGQHHPAVLRHRRLRHRTLPVRRPRSADHPLRHPDCFHFEQWPTTARQHIKRHRGAPAWPLLADPRRGHAPGSHPAYRPGFR